VALAGLEGLDQTVKLPGRVDMALGRLGALVKADPAANAAFGDLPTLMRRVHAKLDAAPARVKGPAGEIALDGFGMQLIAGGMVRAPNEMAQLPALYWMLDRGDYSILGQIVAMMAPATQTLRGMPEAMDIASGISPARLARAKAEARRAVLGEALNFPMPQALGAAPVPDLGEAFRAPFRTKVPALLMAGTLDGRTPLEEQREVGRQFSDARWIVVENGGHNVLGASPEIGAAMVAFFKGEPVASRTIRLPPPKFLLPG
jgi:pimeloyl-ACP methyl ester carboxylesterase